MSDRWRTTCLAIAAGVCFASTVRADSAVITSGFISMFWDGSLSGIDLQGDGTHLIAEDMGVPPQSFQAGQIADLSTTVGSSVNHTVTVTVNGTTYSSVWVRTQFSVAATPFVVPHAAAGTSNFFSTPISMTGEFDGFTDQAMTNQVFAVSLSGSGVASIGPMNAIGEDTFILRSGGLSFRFATAVPSPWTSADIGSVGQSGTASFDNGTFFVSGSGSDIWGSDDSFQFVSRTLAGDGAIIARVTGISNTNTFAKAGIMIRGSSSASAADVILDLRPSNGIEFMTRSSDGGATAYLGGAVQAPAVWLRLTRSGTTIAAAVSTDGLSWASAGTTTLEETGPVLVGLAVTSHDTSQLNTSTFDNVTVTQALPTIASDIVIYASDVPASALHGAWSFAADPTAAAETKLVTPDNGVSNTSEPLAAPDHYFDVTFNAVPDTSYTIWLRLQSPDKSKWNDSVWVQFSDAKADGTDVYPISSTSALLVNLATDSSATSLNGWGWVNGAYWLSQATRVTFGDNATHTLRIQVREDGVQLDQIVLSPATFASSAPGPVTDDHTIVPK
jgi:regulation of enolase protein 1 (concanavalin A-like superfamily)